MVQVPLLIQESSDSGVGPYLPNLDADCDDDVHHHHLASGRRQESNLVALTLYDILSNRGHVHPVGHGSLQQDYQTKLHCFPYVCVSYGVGYCRHLRGPTGDMGLAARIGFLLHSGVHDQHLPGVGNGLDQRVAGQPPQFSVVHLGHARVVRPHRHWTRPNRVQRVRPQWPRQHHLHQCGIPTRSVTDRYSIHKRWSAPLRISDGRLYIWRIWRAAGCG